MFFLRCPVVTKSTTKWLHFRMDGCMALQSALAVSYKAALFAKQLQFRPISVELQMLLEIFPVPNLDIALRTRNHLTGVFIGMFAFNMHFKVWLFIGTDVVTQWALDALFL